MVREDICKYVVCYLYGLNPLETKVYTIVHDDHIEANYKNALGQLIDNKIRINGEKVVWGAKNGRWRIHEKDSKIAFELLDDQITIIEKHYEGQVISKTFKINKQ